MIVGREIQDKKDLYVHRGNSSQDMEVATHTFWKRQLRRVFEPTGSGLSRGDLYKAERTRVDRSNTECS